MESLNNIIESAVEVWWGEIETELILDPKMPVIYDDNHNLYIAFTELLNEVNRHTKSDRRRVKTLLKKDIQFLELAWNGSPLSSTVIDFMNRGYDVGNNDNELSEVSGTRRAGYFLSKYKGNVKVENFKDGIYVVRNLIEIKI